MRIGRVAAARSVRRYQAGLLKRLLLIPIRKSRGETLSMRFAKIGSSNLIKSKRD